MVTDPSCGCPCLREQLVVLVLVLVLGQAVVQRPGPVTCLRMIVTGRTGCLYARIRQGGMWRAPPQQKIIGCQQPLHKQWHLCCSGSPLWCALWVT